MRYRTYFKGMAYLTFFTFLLTLPLQAYTNALIIPTDKVKVYQDDKIVQEISMQVPLPINAKMKAKGNCGIRLTDINLVLRDKSVFSILNLSPNVGIKLEKGLRHCAEFCENVICQERGIRRALFIFICAAKKASGPQRQTAGSRP